MGRLVRDLPHPATLQELLVQDWDSFGLTRVQFGSFKIGYEQAIKDVRDMLLRRVEILDDAMHAEAFDEKGRSHKSQYAAMIGGLRQLIGKVKNG